MREAMKGEMLLVLLVEKTWLYIGRRGAETAGKLGGREWAGKGGRENLAGNLGGKKRRERRSRKGWAGEKQRERVGGKKRAGEK
jgi:hypothetical protein